MTPSFCSALPVAYAKSTRSQDWETWQNLGCRWRDLKIGARIASGARRCSACTSTIVAEYPRVRMPRTPSKCGNSAPFEDFREICLRRIHRNLGTLWSLGTARYLWGNFGHRCRSERSTTKPSEGWNGGWIGSRLVSGWLPCIAFVLYSYQLYCRTQT